MASKHRKRRQKRPQRPETPLQPRIEEEKARRRRVSGWRGWLWGLAILCGLWALLASALPPTVLRGVVENSLSDALNAPVTLESLSVNPFTLRISVRGVRVPYLEDEGNAAGGESPDGSLLTIEHLEIRPHLHLFSGDAPLQASLRISRPVLDISYLGNGAFSFSRLLPATSEDVEDGTLFALSDMSLEEGTVLLRDGPVGMVHKISDVAFRVPLLSSAAAGSVPTLTALVNGTRIDVEGRTAPDAGALRTDFAIHTAPLHMEHFRRYLADFTPLRLNSGTVALDMVFSLSQPSLGSVSGSLSGTARITDVEIASPEDVVIGRLRNGRVTLTDFTLAERRIRLDAMELDGLYLRVSRDREGRIDWENWARGAGATPEALAPETPFVVEGADLILRNSDFSWNDAGNTELRHLEITGVDGRIAEFSTRSGARTAMRLSFGISGAGVLAVDGEGTLNPPSLRASLWVDDLPLALFHPLLEKTPLGDVQGRVAVKGGVRFGIGENAAHDAGKGSFFAVTEATASVRDLAFGYGSDGRGRKGAPDVSIRLLQGDGLSFDTQARAFSLNRLTVGNPEVRLNESGLTVGAPAGKRVSPAGGTGKKRLPAGLLTAALPEAGRELLENWRIAVGAVRVSGGQCRLTESGDVFSGLGLETGPLSDDLSTPFAFTARAGREAEALTLKGTLRPVPLQLKTRLDAANVPLERFAPLVRTVGRFSASGSVSAGLEAVVEERKSRSGAPTPDMLDALDVRVAGSLGARDAAIKDSLTGKTYALLRRFAAEGLRYASVAGTLEVEDVLLDRLRLDVALEPNSELDILKSLRHTKTSAPSSSSSSSLRFSAASLQCQEAALLFRDQLHGTVFAVQDVDAKIRGLSSAGGGADVAFSGQIGGAPFHLSGSCDPFSSPPVAKLAFDANGVDLARYSAYTSAYLGYPVVQGRLDLESRLSTAGWTFALDNRLRLEKPVLGPRDARSGAPEYPVPLGLSLLEDLRGNVTLDLPVSGRFDENTVEVGGLVGKAFGGLFTKILTSPLALLGGLVGLVTPDEPALQLIGFPAGGTRINPAADERLKRIAEALGSRPRVRVRLIGMYEPVSDARGLKRQRVLDKVRRMALPHGRQGDKLEPETYERFLRRLYRTSAGRKVRGNETPDVMEQYLQSLETITQKDLETLAVKRAGEVRAVLLRHGPALATRVEVASGGTGNAVRPGTAQVELQIY